MHYWKPPLWRIHEMFVEFKDPIWLFSKRGSLAHIASSCPTFLQPREKVVQLLRTFSGYMSGWNEGSAVHDGHSAEWLWLVECELEACFSTTIGISRSDVWAVLCDQVVHFLCAVYIWYLLKNHCSGGMCFLVTKCVGLWQIPIKEAAMHSSSNFR